MVPIRIKFKNLVECANLKLLLLYSVALILAYPTFNFILVF